MPMLTRRSLLRTAAAGAAFTATPAFAQGNWPNQNVRMIVPYPAGGSTDVLFRILAERLKDKLGQTFTVENRPGASGNIGIDQVVKSAPDGYTIGCATVGHFAINRHLTANMPFNAEKELIAPALTYELPNVAVVAAKHVPATTLQEFIAWAKARPNGIPSVAPVPAPRRTSPACCSRRAPASRRSTSRSRARRRPFRRCYRATSISRSTISRPMCRRSDPETCARWPSPRRSAGRPCRTCPRWPRQA